MGSATNLSAAQEVKRLVKLADVVRESGVPLERDGPGSRLKGCCPFHKEKNPYLKIDSNSEGEWYHCYGCGAHGDVFTYLQRKDNLDFRAAMEQLSARAGLTLRKRRHRVADHEQKGEGGSSIPPTTLQHNKARRAAASHRWAQGVPSRPTQN
jgi:DNA primase